MGKKRNKSFNVSISLFLFQMKDNKWHKTVLEFKTKKVERLPIVDISPTSMEDNVNFKIELGPICFA